jgi:hypothetical protein
MYIQPGRYINPPRNINPAYSPLVRVDITAAQTVLAGILAKLGKPAAASSSTKSLVIL